MIEYTFDEYTEMQIIYVDARCNGLAVQLIYYERFRQRLIPSRTIFKSNY